MPSYNSALKDAEKNIIQAAGATVNIVAALARKNAQENIKNQFTTRNNFTANSVRFTPSQKSKKKLDGIKSETGITERAGYMARQETGGTRRSENGGNLIIPNTRARGGSNKNTVRRKFYYANIKNNMVSFPSRNGSRKAASVAQAYVATKTKKFIRRKNAIFSVSNFRKTKSGVTFRLKEILNLKHKTTYTSQNEWLKPASEDAAKDMQAIFNSQMEKI